MGGESGVCDCVLGVLGADEVAEEAAADLSRPEVPLSLLPEALAAELSESAVRNLPPKPAGTRK